MLFSPALATYGDKLISFGGDNISYDEYGRTSNYRGKNILYYGHSFQQISRFGNASFTYYEDGMRRTKTVGGVTHYYTYDGINLIKEEWGDNILLFLYDTSGSPVGMQYRNSTYASGVWDTYYYEKNLQGDIVAVYNSSGTKLVTYTYDAWGYIISTTYSNGGSTTSAQYNPLKYRGYYYDDDLDLYYLATRYYDPEVCRFVTADKILSNISGDLCGYNLYVYCFNNPLLFVDPQGDWPKWSGVWGAISGFLYNIDNAFFSSIEFRIGVGFGIGIDISSLVTIELSRDSYLGLDDGCDVTGNVITAEISLLDSDFKIGNTYDHLVEKDGFRVSPSGNAWDGPFEMVNYPDVTNGNEFSFLIFAINSEQEFLISFSAGVHFIIGGHVTASFNVSEFFERLFD